MARSRTLVAGVGLIAAVATTVAVLVLVYHPAWLGSSRADSLELQELARALAHEPARPVEGRMSGGVPYSPVAAATRGVVGREASPDVRIAAARIEKLAREIETPRNNAALGSAYLALGNWDGAVEMLEDATRQEPANATFQNDLSVAYLARAARVDRPEDWANGLAAARRAIALDPTRPEPYFNRALSLHGLHMSPEEADAWRAYASVDRSSPWTTESADRLNAVERAQAPEAAHEAPNHQVLREQIEDDLLARWGAATGAGDLLAAERLLAEAEQLAERLVDGGGDAMARDEIDRIRRSQAAGDRSMVRDLAIGHSLYGAARERFLRDSLGEASDLMANASTYLRRAGSPYWHMAPITRAILLRSMGRSQAALDLLKGLPPSMVSPRYLYLRGRVAWIESLLQVGIGRYDIARDLLTRSVEAFRAAGEPDNLIATQTNLAEAEWFLGDPGRAWANLVAVLSAIESRGTTRRVHYELAATMALGAGLPEAALEFHDALARVSAGRGPSAQANTYLRRARTHERARDHMAAVSDVERASAALAAVEDVALRRQIGIEIEITKAQVFGRMDCRQAMLHADAALEQLVRDNGTVRRGAVLTMRAKCRESMGDTPGAKDDLVAAVEVFEARRANMSSAADRVQAFELERAAFSDLVRLQAVTLGDDTGALQTAERSRTGVLAEAWPGNPGDPVDHRSLPPDVVIVYYESLADRVLVWVLTREQRAAFSRPISEATLRRSVARIQRAIQQGADLAGLQPHSAILFDALIAPALDIADSAAQSPGIVRKSTVVFVPDGSLFAVPFGALPDGRGRPLIETRVVAVAPSVRTFLSASARLGTFVPAEVLAVGDGHDAASTGLPRLPRADDEAESVARIYPRSVVLVGSGATKQRFLGIRSSVIHFAGHSVLNERFPMFSRMLLAPDPSGGDSGWLLGTEITPDRFGGTYVVVLATCEGAAGRPIEGEGAISVARAFFAAGVPAVIASLWPVDDDLQTLFGALHRSLRVERDAARALREGQLAILKERGIRTPVRVWGGFIMLGGHAPLRGQEERRG
ncbi:MAG TPA: CHAT domain-containing protein [Gemmatimonadales bacterium]|nr:CHAT domain-containing protein [Gemmatimonadales bacterium]